MFALAESDPGKFICNYATQNCLECILIASHGVAVPDKPAKFSRALDYVLKNADQPVLVIPLHLNRLVPEWLKMTPAVSSSKSSRTAVRSQSSSPKITSV